MDHVKDLLQSVHFQVLEDWDENFGDLLKRIVNPVFNAEWSDIPAEKFFEVATDKELERFSQLFPDYKRKLASEWESVYCVRRDWQNKREDFIKLERSLSKLESAIALLKDADTLSWHSGIEDFKDSLSDLYSESKALAESIRDHLFPA